MLKMISFTSIMGILVSTPQAFAQLSLSKNLLSLSKTPRVIVCASVAKNGGKTMPSSLVDYATDMGFMNHLGVIQKGNVVDVTDGGGEYKVNSYNVAYGQSSTPFEFSSSNYPSHMLECARYNKWASGYTLYNKDYTSFTISLSASGRPNLNMKFDIYVVAHPNGSKVVPSEVMAQYQNTVDQYSKIFLGLKSGLFSWGRWSYGYESIFNSYYKVNIGISAF